MLRIKRVQSPELRDKVYELRYRAYRSEEAIQQSVSTRFEDKYDHQDNHVLWALTDDDQIVGSIRATWYDPDKPDVEIPEMEGYRDDLSSYISSKRRMLSGNRFVTDPRRRDRGRLYAMLLLRCHMVVAHDKSDYSLAAVRVNHLQFYRRVLRLDKISVGRQYPGLISTMFLTACEFSKNIDDVYRANPVLKPNGGERIFLDDSCKSLWEVGLPACK